MKYAIFFFGTLALIQNLFGMNDWSQLPWKKAALIQNAIMANNIKLMKQYRDHQEDFDLTFEIARRSRNRRESKLSEYTPLSLALEYKRFEIVQLLLQAGASPNAAWKAANIPLRLAVNQRNPETVDLLLAYGASIHYETKDPLAEGRTAFEANILARTHIRNTTEADHHITMSLIYAGASIRETLLWCIDAQSTKACELLLKLQEKVNDQIKTLLLCLVRMKKEGSVSATTLYNNRKKLLFPYLPPFISVSQLATINGSSGKSAHDLLHARDLEDAQYIKQMRELENTWGFWLKTQFGKCSIFCKRRKVE